MSATFAKSLLAAAAEVEAAETNLKDAILRAAESGDIPRVAEIVRRWKDMPPTEVLASMEVDPCGAPEVTQAEHHRRGAGGRSQP